MKFRHFVSCLCLSLVCLFSITTARADVELPSIFGDSMVLQSELPLPVWGWADPGEEVTVSIASHNGKL